MAGNERVVYSVNVEDVQHVASEQLGRTLKPSEVRAVENRLGDHVDWYGAIEAAVQDTVSRPRRRRAAGHRA